ncbi:recombinase family protein [Mycobacterium sp. MAA66]|uniref:recombinase family protein n=1 Tax=Mycobacterium sp. MAA66 TaxID=3156297 RepID=UPI0035116D80
MQRWPAMSAGRGRPRLCSDEVLQRVVRMRIDGWSYREIADRLNALQIRTPASRRTWTRSHVARLVHTRSAREVAVRCGRREPVSFLHNETQTRELGQD